ncbi:hypothetical protein P3T76_010700 [Phytophthora citrophthora]|uniref:Uncharacterized protein n=1 Tax=Phytophthora citrophthora TaxID=4793 RepID=A0AAD9GBU8_9STRA|nr:hypothetical protein P3T76_010700 [Phytophthora citrophthora]
MARIAVGCCSLANLPRFDQSNLIMNIPADIAINDYNPPRCEVNATKKTQDKTHPSFASRVLRLVFKRNQQPTELQTKSWPGRHESDCEVVPTASKRQFSPNISIPNSLTSSAPSVTSTAPSVTSTIHPRRQRVRMRSVDANEYGEDHWRQRQTYCVNCERLFLKSMSSLSSTAGRFCSLDCKANFEYVTQLQNMVPEFEAESISCGISLLSNNAYYTR